MQNEQLKQYVDHIEASLQTAYDHYEFEPQHVLFESMR